MSIVSNFLGNPRLRQFFLYAICGGAGVLADLCIYSGLVLAGINYLIANTAGYAVGTLVSFTLNRHFTFQTYDSMLRRLSLFFGVALAGYLVSSAALWLLISQLTVNVLIAKILTLLIVLALQFSLNRAITFRTFRNSH